MYIYFSSRLIQFFFIRSADYSMGICKSLPFFSWILAILIRMYFLESPKNSNPFKSNFSIVRFEAFSKLKHCFPTWPSEMNQLVSSWVWLVSSVAKVSRAWFCHHSFPSCTADSTRHLAELSQLVSQSKLYMTSRTIWKVSINILGPTVYSFSLFWASLMVTLLYILGPGSAGCVANATVQVSRLS